MNNLPLVSVVIPTFQRCSSVKYALESLCVQTLAADSYEVIVVIDAEGFPIQEYHFPMNAVRSTVRSFSRVTSRHSGICT